MAPISSRNRFSDDFGHMDHLTLRIIGWSVRSASTQIINSNTKRLTLTVFEPTTSDYEMRAVKAKYYNCIAVSTCSCVWWGRGLHPSAVGAQSCASALCGRQMRVRASSTRKSAAWATRAPYSATHSARAVAIARPLSTDRAPLAQACTSPHSHAYQRLQPVRVRCSVLS